MQHLHVLATPLFWLLATWADDLVLVIRPSPVLFGPRAGVALSTAALVHIEVAGIFLGRIELD